MSNINEKHLAPFPPDINFNSVKILKALVPANQAVAELKGTARSLPNQYILVDMLHPQEMLIKPGAVKTKEVNRYQGALRLGYDAWCEHRGIYENMLIEIFQNIKQRSDNYRETPVQIWNKRTGEVIYTPPQGEQQIAAYMHDLEAFINGNKYSEIHPLIKMTLIHHQFESIHPFLGGNGRTGRILNALYLTHAGKLDAPILYLSRTINRTRPEYYRLLQAVRDEGVWEDWIVYMLDVVTVTAISTLKLVTNIRHLMQEARHHMQKELKFYSQDLLDILFHYPYTQIDYVAKKLGVHYSTAASYLKKLTAAGIVVEEKYGTRKSYVNRELIYLFFQAATEDALETGTINE